MKTTNLAYLNYDVQGTKLFVNATGFTEREFHPNFWTVSYSDDGEVKQRRFESGGAALLFANEKIDQFVEIIYGLRICN